MYNLTQIEQLKNQLGEKISSLGDRLYVNKKYLAGNYECLIQDIYKGVSFMNIVDSILRFNYNSNQGCFNCNVATGDDNITITETIVGVVGTKLKVRQCRSEIKTVNVPGIYCYYRYQFDDFDPPLTINSIVVNEQTTTVNIQVSTNQDIIDFLTTYGVVVDNGGFNYSVYSTDELGTISTSLGDYTADGPNDCIFTTYEREQTFNKCEYIYKELIANIPCCVSDSTFESIYSQILNFINQPNC